MTVTALDPSSALVIIDLQNAIVGAPTVPHTGPEVVTRAVELARTYRFAATVFAINPAVPIDWGGLAGGAGYFDQAHVSHEFRAFTGLTPTRPESGGWDPEAPFHFVDGIEAAVAKAQETRG
jgi:nicotinamidase-related amidase